MSAPPPSSEETAAQLAKARAPGDRETPTIFVRITDTKAREQR